MCTLLMERMGVYSDIIIIELITHHETTTPRVLHAATTSTFIINHLQITVFH